MSATARDGAWTPPAVRRFRVKTFLDGMRLRGCVLCLVLFAASPAFAQYGGAPAGGGQPGILHQRGGGRAGGAATGTAAPQLKVPPDAWPRLDPGATLCITVAALKLYQAAEAKSSGADDPTPPLPSGCARVTESMAVSIVQRDGPSREEVKSTTPPGHNGWTDAWLPDAPP